MPTPPSLDVSQLFPFPTEQAMRLTPAVDATSPGSPPVTDPATSEPARGSAELLAASLQQLNTGLQNFGIEFEFSEPGNHLVTRVVDRESGELIRQIPSEEVLRMAQRMESRIGLLLQEKA